MFTIAYCVLINWYLWCTVSPELNPKCRDDSTNKYFTNLYLLEGTCFAMSCCLYHQAHFLFAFRYFEVAEMFGRKDKTMKKHIKIRKVTSKISYAVVGLIAINYLIYIADFANNRINHKLDTSKIYDWTYMNIPSFFLTADCALLVIGLVWICHSLKHDPKVMGNEKWMAVHTILLILTLGAWTY
jgi:hypothetical protein